MKQLIFSLLIASTALAQVHQKPAPGPVPKSAFPPYVEKKLSNGLRFVIVENHKEPLVYFRTLILSGNAEDRQSIGAASAVANLLEKGTKTRSADDIAKKLDYYGAEIGASSSVDDINIFISCMKKDLNQVLPVYADVIKNPIFPKEEFDKYSAQTISGLTAAKQRPSDLARKMGRILTYGPHPYGEIETEATVGKLTPEILQAWHATNFVAENAIIAIVGDITESEIAPMLEKYFGDWKQGMKIQPAFPILEDTRGTSISLVNRPSSVQSTVRLQRLGLSVTDPDFDKASLLMSIFAGNGTIGFQNRLFQNIREKHGYTYTPGGSLTTSLDRGVMVAVAEVRNNVTDSALDQMLIEYRRLSTEPVPDTELNFAKGLITGKYLMELADPNVMSARVLSILEYKLPRDYYSTYASRISGYSSEELLNVGRRVFSQGDLNIIVVGDASAVRPKLERFGRVNTYDLDLKPVAFTEEKVAPSSASLDDVLNLMYKGVNKPALEKITSREIDGERTITVATEKHAGAITIIEAAPNKKYQKFDLGGMVMESRNDGQHIYQYYPGANGTIDPEEKYELAATIFNEELHLKDPNVSVKLLGTGETPGGEAYILDVTKNGLEHEKWYVSKDKGYIVRKSFLSGENPLTTDYSDFRMVDGIPYPFHEEAHGAADISLQISSIKHNVPVDNAMFTKK